MTEEQDKLRAALQAAPPPAPDAKAAAIAVAMKNFDRLHQGTADAVRPIQDRPQNAGFLNGVRQMFATLTTRPILTATTSVAALSLGLIVVLPLASRAPDTPPPQPPTATAEASAPALPAERQPDTNVTAESPPPAATPALRKAAAPENAPNRADARALTEAGATATGTARPARPAPVQSLHTTAPDQTGAPDADAPAMRAQESIEFAPKPANPIRVTADSPVSTFAADVDTASYAFVRASLIHGTLPDPQAVRIEEMINYFPYSYPAPQPGEAPFSSTVTVMPTPWNDNTRLVRIGLQGRLPAVAARPALNLVFLIDTSGSMQSADKLPLLKQSLRLLLPQLRPLDEVAIVAYAGSAGEVLPPTPAKDAAAILDALDRLTAGGPTAGTQGLDLAYRIAERMTGKGEVGRVLLATDGDFNVGVSDPEGLERYIAKKRAGGTYLSVLGFGRGNADDAAMQALAQAGNGMAAYIDTLNEAQKVLADQLTGALFPIADDVKIQVEWNPAQVAEYRLIGYETRALAREDFNNDKVDAGEIGAGHTVTALYEVTAPGSPALANDPLRYDQAAPPADGPASDSPELGFLRLRYKAPGETISALLETPIYDQTAPADEDARFAAAIAGFGQLLTGESYPGDWGWDDAIALALGARGDDVFGYRAEAVSLMRLARSLAAQ